MEQTFKAPDIECGGCAASIRKALTGADGIEDVSVDVGAKTVTVVFDGTKTSARIVAEALTDIGFPPEGVSS